MSIRIMHGYEQYVHGEFVTSQTRCQLLDDGRLWINLQGGHYGREWVEILMDPESAKNHLEWLTKVCKDMEKKNKGDSE